MMKLAVFGNPVEQSKSPLIHAEFARDLGLQIEYQKILAPLDDFFGSVNLFFKNPLAKGCNVTVPFKQDAAKWVTDLSERAKLAGAVNTIIKVSDDCYRGDNTDGIGLVADLQANAVNLENAKVLLIGAGGAARGVIKPLLDKGLHSLTVANRTFSKAQELALLFKDKRLTAIEYQQLSCRLDNDLPFDLIINSTSASLSGELPAISDHIYAGVEAVYDMVYGNQPTVFMQHARNLGVNKQIDGLGMLVEQAAESFYLWTDVRPETTAVMKMLRAG